MNANRNPKSSFKSVWSGVFPFLFLCATVVAQEHPGGETATDRGLPRLPRGTTVRIVKSGRQAASVVVIQGERRWNVTEKTLDEAPEAVVPYLKALFQGVAPPRGGGESVEGTEGTTESPQRQRDRDEPSPDQTPEHPQLEITYRIEESAADAPGIEDWAKKAVELCRVWHPKLKEYLASDGFTPTARVELIFRKMNGVAFSSGNTIVISSDWVTRQPNDWGMVVHELVHVIQSYRRRVPGWITEGIADYIRHALFEPQAPMRSFQPDRAKYTDAYQITAAFFMWIDETKCKDFVPKINKVLRQGEYTPEFFVTQCGANVDELWAAYIEDVKNGVFVPNRKNSDGTD